jgi:hypothetical protein
MYGTLISTQTLTGTAASVTFSSIPATYTDLYLTVSGRSDFATSNTSLAIRFNGDTGINYLIKLLKGDGSTASSPYTPSDNAFFPQGVIPAASNTANTFSNVIATIPNYAGSTVKLISVEAVGENNATAAGQAIMAGSWNSTAAITSITALPSSGNFTTGSTLSLYGLTHF